MFVFVLISTLKIYKIEKDGRLLLKPKDFAAINGRITVTEQTKHAILNRCNLALLTAELKW